MKLSRRLEGVLSLTRSGNVAADIGTDHGFVPIELIRRGLFARALACDLREGPLARAGDHIREAGLTEKIELRQADGLRAVTAGEADAILITGMGGPLMERILSEASATAHSARQLILSPQSKVGEFRRYLLTHGYRIEEEAALTENGKYYVILRSCPGEEEVWDEEELLYGRRLLIRGDPATREQIEREMALCGRILSCGKGSRERRTALRLRQERAKRALQRMPRRESGEGRTCHGRGHGDNRGEGPAGAGRNDLSEPGPVGTEAG